MSEDKVIRCPKCKYTSGDSWNQCDGFCPMPMSPHFWKSVRELAAMRDQIPEERRAMSGVREAVRLDVLPEENLARIGKIAKKLLRDNFRKKCLIRDNYTCLMCNKEANHSPGMRKVHLITSSAFMPGGGYVESNGITLCGTCQFSVEACEWLRDELYDLIDSSYDKALSDSKLMLNFIQLGDRK